jgi:acetyl esterase/lipase
VTGADSSVHPQLRAPLEAYRSVVGPRGIGGISDVRQRRAAAADLARRAAATRPMPATVTVRDELLPGLTDGAPQVRARLYLPAGHQAGLPAGWLYVHGGGMTVGDLDSSDLAAANLAADSGCAILSVDYRLAPEVRYPGALDDCAAALAWLHANAAELHLSAKRIGVYGVSAGGLLAASLTLRSRDGAAAPVAKQILIYPMLDDRTSDEPTTVDAPEGTWSHSSNLAAWEAYLGPAEERRSPAAYRVPARASCLSNLPPTYLEVGSIDILAVEGVSYAARLIASGVETELHVHPGAYHAFDVVAPAAPLTVETRARRLRAMAEF